MPAFVHALCRRGATSSRAPPVSRELVIDCNGPNEATSARAAKRPMAKGYRHGRPMQGGLDAWTAAGYPVRRLPIEAGVRQARVAQPRA